MRVILAVILLAGLGVLLTTLSVSEELDGAMVRICVLAVAAGALGAAWKVWRSAGQGLVLRPDRVVASDGRTVFLLSDVRRLERGVFAVKPANGVVVTLSARDGARWVPGLWWRTGRRVGIGGMTPKAQTRAFADRLEQRLAEVPRQA
ncbi:hypothetical protein [Mangrovicoccus algicola]|uniref:PH domain-containing protein n=1 Tax=Mangrovicoccus algicola TaxID=2771008 RepID=A0A8J6YXZ3_9RHOB|nr:hypothetical protein [Mangrovicoccus algicola]MBE3637823.1 hypothetical protein [Mangrovicoccus algicola]